MPSPRPTSDPFDPNGIYYVRIAGERKPLVRLAIAPQLRPGRVLFFDTIRQRVVTGEVVGDEGGVVHFEQPDGTRLTFEPMTLARFRELAPRIEGSPDFDTIEELRQFYLRMVRGHESTDTER